MHELLDRAANERPDKWALRDSSGRWRYRELAGQSIGYSRVLACRGIQRGDRVVSITRASREAAALFYAASRIGAAFVPLHPNMKSYQLLPVLNRIDPKLIVTGPETSVEDLHETGFELLGKDDLASHAAKVLDQHDGWEPGEVTVGDTAAVIHTSGSTSIPKGVVCPHAQMTFAATELAARLGYRADDVVFCRFPMSWDYGLYKNLMCTAAMAELVLADGSDDLSLLRLIQECQATIVPIVPSLATMLTRLARRQSRKPLHVRMFTNTGSELTRATIEELEHTFPACTVIPQYGQTEAKRITVMPGGMASDKPGSVGLPLRGTRLRIRRGDGSTADPGEVGEITVAGPNVMVGYWRDPESTARTFRKEGDPECTWLYTGDYGWLDEDGFLYFSGRRDDLFKRRDIRMSAVEIEAALMDVPGVRAAAVLPPTDERDLAMVVEGDLEKPEVLVGLRQRLDLAKIPPICVIVERLPLNAHGKVDKVAAEIFLKDGGE
ncbi:class I adenylate-forming enzyme family protein [Actinomadura meridiana]|uniref:class I adenylate-forming enzyme family protein n=1 Tax=Actinomadura meridiana TaxID=559626 RepID=UPI0031F02DBF